MTRADAWIHFAASVIIGEHHIEPSYAAEQADALLAEFDKRFEPQPNGGHISATYVPDTFQTKTVGEPS